MEEPKKEDRRVRRTRKMLTQALTQLMQEKQIKEITVKELTDLADMNRGTFYLYYRDVYDMLEKLEDSMFEALDSIAALHETDAARQETNPILLDVFHFIEENQEIVRVLLSPHGDMKFLHRLYEVIKLIIYTKENRSVTMLLKIASLSAYLLFCGKKLCFSFCKINNTLFPYIQIK